MMGRCPSKLVRVRTCSRKDFELIDTPFISVLEKIEDLITKEKSRLMKPNPTLKPTFIFHLDINLEMNNIIHLRQIIPLNWQHVLKMCNVMIILFKFNDHCINW